VTETQKVIEALGRKVSVYTADLSSAEEVRNVVPKVLEDGHTIRILINCAGIQIRHACEVFPDDDFNKVTDSDSLPFSAALAGLLIAVILTISKVMQVNLNSVFSLCRDVGAHMLSLEPSPVTGRRGSIINFASLLTFQGGLNVPAYAASKGAVGQLAKSMANQWSDRGITVNCIAPGYIETDMNTALLNDPKRLASISERIPAGRWGSPDDFKGSVVFLASKASGYVTGHTLVVDGGWMGR
jgi:2-deoxy-D-gluconate 3-dehydrogenase